MTTSHSTTTILVNLAALVAATILVIAPASARNVEYTLPLDEVLRMPAARQQLDGSVRFYLYGQDHAPMVSRHSEEVMTGKIGGAGEEEIESCKRAALKALVRYQEKARKMGANAILDMVSFYDDNPYMSPAQYECHAGSHSVIVVFKGSYAKIAY